MSSDPLRRNKREYTKRARAEGEAKTRRAIVEAALECFSQQPFELVTVKVLADRAGLSAQTLLRIHGSKDAIFLAMVHAVAGALIAERDRAAGGDVRGALRSLVDDYERWGDFHERLQVRSRQMPELAALFEAWRLRHRRWVRQTFDAALQPVEGPARRRLLGLLVVVLDIGTYRRLRLEGLSRAAAESALLDLTEVLSADPKKSKREASR